MEAMEIDIEECVVCGLLATHFKCVNGHPWQSCDGHRGDCFECGERAEGEKPEDRIKEPSGYESDSEVDGGSVDGSRGVLERVWSIHDSTRAQLGNSPWTASRVPARW